MQNEVNLYGGFLIFRTWGKSLEKVWKRKSLEGHYVCHMPHVLWGFKLDIFLVIALATINPQHRKSSVQKCEYAERFSDSCAFTERSQKQILLCVCDTCILPLPNNLPLSPALC